MERVVPWGALLALIAVEREQVPSVANEPRFADMPVARVVPMLARREAMGEIVAG